MERCEMIATLIAGQLTGTPEEKKTRDGRTMVSTLIKARVGRENVEHWKVIAYSPAARNQLLNLKMGEFLCVQGVGHVTPQRIDGDVVLMRSIFAEAVLPLRTRGEPDASLS
jgi:hypothetical protein